MNILNEELNRFKLMMKYDTKNTLSENTKLIFENEGLLKAAMADTRLLQNALTDLKSTESFKAVKTADNVIDAINAAKQGKYLESAISDLVSVLKKQSDLPQGLKQELSSSIRETTAFKNKASYRKYVKEQNWGALETALKNSKDGKGVRNYSDEMVDQIVKDMKSGGKSTSLAPIKSSSTELSVIDKSAKETGVAKEELISISKESNAFTKKKDYLKNFWENFKNKKFPDLTKKRWYRAGFLKFVPGRGWVLSRRKALFWLLAIGGTTSYYLFKDWLKKSGIFIDDKEDVKKIDDSNNGGGTGGGAGGGTGGGTNYTECTDFPYKKGCSSSVVAEVQSCLKIKPIDGKFGPKTEKALTAGGYGTEITQDVYNKIKEKCGSSSNTNNTTVDPNKVTANDVTYTDVSYDEL